MSEDQNNVWHCIGAQYRRRVYCSPVVTDDTPVTIWTGIYRADMIEPEGKNLKFLDDRGHELPVAMTITSDMSGDVVEVVAWGKVKLVKESSHIYLRIGDVHEH